MTRRLPATTLLMGLAVLTAACGDDGDDTVTGSSENAGEDPSDAAGADVDGLLDRTFVSVAVTENGSERELVDGTSIEITFFGEDTRMGWSAGCNGFGTDTLEIDGDRLVVGEVNGTEVGCAAELHEQDDWLAEVMTSEPTWSLDDETLTLETDTTVIELEEGEAAPDPDEDPQPDDAPTGHDEAEHPDDGGADAAPSPDLAGTTWQVTDLIDGETISPVDPGAEATVSFNDGDLGIDACNTGGSPIHEITDGEIEVEPPIMTMMACGPPLDDVERAIVAVLDGRISYVVDGDALTLTHPAGNGLVLTART